MSKINSQRKGCKDVFNAFLVSDADYDGYFEFPRLTATHYIPDRVLPFSKAINSKKHDYWIHFYEDDYEFERFWKNPQRYIEIIKRFKGVILPDFSLYRDMPLAMQIWNIYRSRAIGYWLQKRGVKIIPNIRFGDKRTYKVSCNGIEKHCTIAVGSHGNMKHREDREIFTKGLDVVLKTIEPETIIVYGAAPDRVFGKCRKAGIQVIQFDSAFAISHKEEK